MKAAKREAMDIMRMREAMSRTKSEHLKMDYAKGIKRKEKELKTYCRYRGIDYGSIDLS